MNDIKKILVPFDVSAASEQALKFALGFITKDDAPEIVIVHSSNAIEDNTLVTTLKEKISVIKDEFPYVSKSKVELVLRHEVLIDTIINEQKEYGVDLVIMGTKGSIAKDECHITNTAELVLEANCPVLVVPEQTKGFEVHKIALVLGKEEIDDPSVLSVLLEVARRFKAQVHVLTIVNEDGTYGYSVADEKNENTIAYYLEKFYSHHTFRENQDVEQGIFDYVRDQKIDMVAILPSNHAKQQQPSEGRLTKLLTLHTKVPLLTLD